MCTILQPDKIILCKNEFKQIPEYPSYSINKEGGVYSNYYKRLLNVYKQPNNYLVVKLCKDKKVKQESIHNLLLSTFVCARPLRNFGCHNNGNSLDNRLENLRWDTPKNNTADRIKHGTNAGPSPEKARSAKLNWKKVALVKLLNKEFKWSKAKISRLYSMHQSTICDVINNRIWIK